MVESEQDPVRATAGAAAPPARPDGGPIPPSGAMAMTDTGREITGATATTELATFGGGCFWCLEPVFDALDGVLDVVSGYSGGHVPDPRYEDVCAGTTGHAE